MEACTTAVLSGKATVDGRPILLKHRDSNFFQNKLMYFSDGQYDYIGLVNSEDKEGKEVWSGANSVGFAIMNAASYNLNDNDTTKLKDQEGIVMKAALQTCKTVDDFGDLLDNWAKPMGVEANFGVIDAYGGAVYYETTNFGYTKFDVTDPTVAPDGYLIRTNYSTTGTTDGGYGYIRFTTAESLFKKGIEKNDLSYRYLLQDVSRSLRHSLLNLNLLDKPYPPENEDYYVNFQDYIPRHSSVTTMAVQGVLEGENPNLTTIWTILGFPLCSVALPTWVTGGKELPTLLIPDDSGNAPLCKMALELKKKCFPVARGSGWKYINLTALLTNQSTGILQKLQPIENSIFELTEKHLSKWRSSDIEKSKILSLYRQLTDFLIKTYKSKLGM
jgi:hypothetical protein